MFELLYGRLPWGSDEEMDPVDLVFIILTKPIIFEEADANCDKLVLKKSEYAKHLMGRFLNKVQHIVIIFDPLFLISITTYHTVLTT